MSKAQPSQMRHYQRTSVIWRADLSSTEILLMLALNEYVDSAGRCWPAQSTLAKMTKLSERTVRDHIARLTDRGLIVREKQPKRGGGWHYKYRILWNAFPETEPENISGPVERTGNDFPSGPETTSPPDRKQFPPNLSREPIHGTVSCSEPGQSGSKPATADDPIVLTFPTVGSGPKEWHLRQSKLAEYVKSYPGIDVLAECRQALQWTRDNPTRRKTARGMTGFLNRWLNRSQDSGPRNARAQGNGTVAADPHAGLAEQTARRRLEYERRARAMGGQQ